MINRLLCNTLGVAVVILSVTAPGGAATVQVTPATLNAAFAAATGGDTLQLVGTFGNVRLQNRSFTKVVTLDASHAVFTDTLILQRDRNIKLWRGEFDVAGGSSYNAAIDVWDGSNIVVDRSTIFGNGTEAGINFERTTNATASNGHFDGLHVAVSLGSVNGGVATRNVITHAEADGIDIGDSHGVMASYNSCTLGAPGPGVHPDCIQLWSVAGNPLESDVTVTRNTATGPTQGFTAFSTGGGQLRATITRNTVTSSFPQGIACYNCIDSNISYNSVSTLAGAAHVTNITVLGGSGNTVVGNVVHAPPVPKPTAFAMASRMTVRGGIDTYDPMLDFSGRNDGVNAVPEPATWAMLVAGFAAVGLARRRATRSATVAA